MNKPCQFRMAMCVPIKMQRSISLALLVSILSVVGATPSLAFLSTCPRQTQLKLHHITLHKATGVNEGELDVMRGDEACKLAYRIVRPMSLSSRQAAPIVVLHGGPSVPSDYLYPLADVVPYRSIVYHNQIGCGVSSEPDDASLYSIDQAVDDLEALLKKLGLKRFHLYGQSYGGIVAFEYMKRLSERHDEDMECLSAILSSTPTSIKMVQEEADRLLANLQDGNMDDQELAEAFRKEHQCHTEEMPQPLVDAYAKAGSVWRGSSAILDYIAEPPLEDAARMPSCMVLRGEHDFVTDKCIEGWKDCFNHEFVRSKVLDGCSHHGLLENGSMYGELIDSYFAEYD